MRRQYVIVLALLVGVVAVDRGFRWSAEVPQTVKADRPRVLVLKADAPAGYAATMTEELSIRPVADTEMDAYLRERHKYMPPILVAGLFRVLDRDMGANVPLRKSDFRDFIFPPAFDIPQEPDMCALR